MVSAAKLRLDELRLKEGRPFQKYLETIMPVREDLDENEYDCLSESQTPIFVCLTSDKGLCGGVNSVITRQMKKVMAHCAETSKSPKLFIVGDKGRAQMRRIYADNMAGIATEVVAPMTFDMASAIASEVLKIEGDCKYVIYNVFVSAISYTPSIQPITTFSSGEDEALVEYEFEPDTKSEILEDLGEYALTTSIYSGYLEGATSEQSSRMSAMENASKNAGELIDKLTLQYNRARQARITTELIEIISGASALE